VLEHINELAEQRSDMPDWQHGLQLWAGVEENARQHVASGMEEMYRTPFQKMGNTAHMAQLRSLPVLLPPILRTARASLILPLAVRMKKPAKTPLPKLVQFYITLSLSFNLSEFLEKLDARIVRQSRRSFPKVLYDYN
jgi:hypothetical protein